MLAAWASTSMHAGIRRKKRFCPKVPISLQERDPREQESTPPGSGIVDASNHTSGLMWDIRSLSDQVGRSCRRWRLAIAKQHGQSVSRQGGADTVAIERSRRSASNVEPRRTGRDAAIDGRGPAGYFASLALISARPASYTPF